MRRIRFAAALIAAAVIPVTVLAGSAWSGASVTSSQATILSWHRLTLTNGWQPYPTTATYGAPAWAVSGGIVYLRGAVRGGFTTDMATLPRAARPTHWLWVTDVTGGPTIGSILIRPSGLISLNGPGNLWTFTSLSGVSFPVKA
jgi:hypothetical protein